MKWQPAIHNTVSKFFLLSCIIVWILPGTGGAQHVQCFSAVMCAGETITLNSTMTSGQIKECCVSTMGLSYNDSASGQCVDCLVYGFFKSTIDGHESATPYLIQVGYVKGSGPSFTATMREVPGATAVNGVDYKLSSNVALLQTSFPAQIQAEFRLDNVAQENVESVQFQLNLPDTGLPSGGIIQDTVTLIIRDSDEVVIGLTDAEYTAQEAMTSLPLTVSKNIRLANPINVSITPYTVYQTIQLQDVLIPSNIPPQDNPFSTIYAQSSPPDRQDFMDGVISISFPADEQLISPVNIINTAAATVGMIVDDEINEAEEFFVVVLRLENATVPTMVNFSRPSSIVKIIDNDVIGIGFQQESYTFVEPEFVEQLWVPLFKDNQRASQHVIQVSVTVTSATPNPKIRLATHSSDTMDNDYTVYTGSGNVVLILFPPESQQQDIYFELIPDKIAEGTEAFQITAITDIFQPSHISPLFPSTFIVIMDNDCIEIGFEGNYTVNENNGSLEACLHVINPPDGYDLFISIDLVVDTVEGTARETDYTPINSSRGDVRVTLDQQRKRACFPVLITRDEVIEGPETFSLTIKLAAENYSHPIVIDPSVSYVNIEEYTCTDLPTPINGTISYSAGSPGARPANHTAAVYTCDTGFNLIGNDTQFCQVNETWSGNAPTCEIVDCGPPPNVSNGTFDVQTGTTFQETATYVCDFGYALKRKSRQNSVACLADGSWSTPPMCLFVDCGSPPLIAGGYPENYTNTTLGGIITYNCIKGYKFSSDSLGNSSCLITGLWSTPPACSIVNCGPPNAVSNGFPGTPTQTTYGGMVMYSCNSGFIFFTSEAPIGNVTCLATGEWETPPPCVPDVNCGPPPNITNGSPGSPTNTSYAGVVAYSCDEGFAISDIALVSCLGSGQWEALPTCTGIECLVLAQPENGNVKLPSGVISFGAIAMYECDLGYNLSGPVNVTCVRLNATSTIGVWSDYPPVCEAVKCTPLPTVENLKITYAPDSTPDYDIGTVATYQCNSGFTLEGNATRICEPFKNNALWSNEGESRSCIAVTTPQETIIISATLGGVVLLLLFLIIVVVITIVVSRRKAKSTAGGETDNNNMYAHGDHIYEDPDLIQVYLPRLPSRNVHMEGNQAYQTTFEMTGNSAYTREPAVDSEVVSNEVDTSLTSQIIRLRGNQAYGKTFQMTGNTAYNSEPIDIKSSAGVSKEVGVESPNDEGYINVDSYGNEIVDDIEHQPAVMVTAFPRLEHR